MAPEARRSGKRRRFDNLEEYTVLVGPEEEPFIVSKAILGKSSVVLAKSCESDVRTVRLLDQRVEIFAMYLNYLYTGKLVVLEESDEDTQDASCKPEPGAEQHETASHENEEGCYHTECNQFDTLLLLTYFANRFEDVTFGNTIIDAVVKLAQDSDWEPCDYHVKAIYACLPANVGLRKLVVDLFCAGYDPKHLQDRVRMYPAEMFYEIWCRIHATSGGYSRVTRPTVRLDLREEVVVFVGANKDKFTVPKAFLTKSSEFFKTCCNGSWKESETKTIDLSDAEANTFPIYAQWLYSDSLVVTDDDADQMPANIDERERKVRQTYDPLFDLAVFADRYGDVALANAVNDAILRVMCRFCMVPNPAILCRVYSALPKTSKTLSLVADRFAASVNPENLRAPASEYSGTFLLQVWVAMYKAAKNTKGTLPKPTFEQRCTYHEHNDNVPKTAECNEEKV